MKALELANQAFTAWCSDRPIDSQVLLNRCGVELRRLAEVNAELLEALQDMLDAESSYPYGGMSESEIAAVQKARAAIAKATEVTK